MALTNETVSICPATREVGRLLVDLVVQAKALAADGKVSIMEIPTAMTVLLKDLVPAIGKASEVINEEKTNTAEFFMTVHLFANDIAKAVQA